jgi:2-haloacid dehalogenase
VKEYELVLLDADETLFDFRRAEGYALEGAFAQFGLEYTESAFRDYDAINKGLWAALERGETDQASLKVERFRLLFERRGAGPDAALFAEAYVGWLSRASFLLEGAEEACEYLAGKHTLAIVTNGIKEVQRARLEASAIRRFIDHIVISEEAGCSKPGAGIFEYACAKAGFRDKAGMIMVGDSLGSDIKGGIDFGIDTCWVNLVGAANETLFRPTFEIRRLAELRDIL